MADKHDGAVHSPPIRGVALAMNEAIGTVGIVCPDEAPLLAFVTLTAFAIAAGNTAVVIPSERYPLLATDFYQILETSRRARRCGEYCHWASRCNGATDGQALWR